MTKFEKNALIVMLIFFNVCAYLFYINNYVDNTEKEYRPKPTGIKSIEYTPNYIDPRPEEEDILIRSEG